MHNQHKQNPTSLTTTNVNFKPPHDQICDEHGFYFFQFCDIEKFGDFFKKNIISQIFSKKKENFHTDSNFFVEKEKKFD
jgi:hypothetical protein